MDWKTIFTGLAAIVSAMSFIVSLAVLIIGRHVANKITTNDLVHLEADVKEVGEKVDKVLEEVAELKARTDTREAVCNERHKI